MSLDYLSLKPVQSLALGFLLQKKKLILMLPRQEGKTELGVRIARSVMDSGKSRACLFLAKDKKSGKRATKEKFERLFEKEKFEVNTEHVYHKSNKSCINYFESVDKDPDRLRGGTYYFIHWSEIAFSKLDHNVKIMDVYDKVIMPTQRKTDSFTLLESTPNGKNGFFDIWENYRELGFERLKISLTQMMELGLVSLQEYLEIKNTTRKDVFEQEYECNFVSFTGKTYNEFNQHIHVTDRIPPPENWQTCVISIDWGFTHPTCVLFAYIRDGYICVFDEIYKSGMLIEQIHTAIQQKIIDWNISTIAGVADHDPANIKELNDRGIACGKGQKTNVLGARLQVKELLHKNRILISPRCKHLIRDLDNAVWDDKKTDDIDYKMCTWGHFDAEAALRYLVREYSGFSQTRPTELQSSEFLTRAAWKLEFLQNNMEAC